jgi:protein TorT
MPKKEKTSMPRLKTLATLVVGAAFAAAFATSTPAEERPWWPFPAVDFSSGSAVPIEYVPLDKASKKWHVCILVPHMKDSWWVAVAYGLTQEASRLGIKMTLFQAGGYTEVSKQVTQYDDCVALGADAIGVAAVSDAAASKKIVEGREKGIVQIGCANTIFDGPIHAAVWQPPEPVAYQAGKWVVEHFKGRDNVRAVNFPGPGGAGWPEASARGFRMAIEGSNIELVEEKYGETGKSVQLKLIEDTLQTYDDIDLLFGTGVMAEVAVGAVEEAGVADRTNIMSWYSNEGILDAVIGGDILASATQMPVTLGRICVDLAVRVLEGEDYYTEVHPVPQILNQETVKTLDLTTAFAPKGWQPIYSVD